MATNEAIPEAASYTCIIATSFMTTSYLTRNLIRLRDGCILCERLEEEKGRLLKGMRWLRYSNQSNT